MKPKKLYYIPGLVSLIGLPILLFFWGPEDSVYQTVVRLNLPSDKKDEPGIEKFSTAFVYRAIAHKKMVSVDLGVWSYADDRNQYMENKKHSFIAAEMQKIQFTNDTNTVVKITLGSESRYSDFIWLLNQAMLDDFKRYALVDNTLYFFANPPPVHHEAESFYPYGDDVIVIDRKQPTAWESFTTALSYNWRMLRYQLEYLFYQQQQNVWLAAGFLILLLLPALWRLRYRPA